LIAKKALNIPNTIKNDKMIAASTLRTRSRRGQQVAAMESTSSDRMELEQLRMRIVELERLIPQQAAANLASRQERLPIGKPFKFDRA